MSEIGVFDGSEKEAFRFNMLKKLSDRMSALGQIQNFRYMRVISGAFFKADVNFWFRLDKKWPNAVIRQIKS